MKNSIIWLVLLAGVVTTFNSCKEPEPEPDPPIVGTWTRVEYEFTEFPSTFSYWEGYTSTKFFQQETGYTFVFRADGTYSREFTPIVSDQGEWTMTGNNLKVSPDRAADLSIIEDAEVIGLEFDVEGEISEIRMVLSMEVSGFTFPSDASIEAAGGDVNAVPDDQWVPVNNIKILYKFNRLN